MSTELEVLNENAPKMRIPYCPTVRKFWVSCPATTTLICTVPKWGQTAQSELMHLKLTRVSELDLQDLDSSMGKPLPLILYLSMYGVRCDLKGFYPDRCAYMPSREIFPSSAIRMAVNFYDQCFNRVDIDCSTWQVERLIWPTISYANDTFASRLHYHHLHLQKVKTWAVYMESGHSYSTPNDRNIEILWSTISSTLHNTIDYSVASNDGIWNSHKSVLL